MRWGERGEVGYESKGSGVGQCATCYEKKDGSLSHFRSHPITNLETQRSHRSSCVLFPWLDCKPVHVSPDHCLFGNNRQIKYNKSVIPAHESRSRRQSLLRQEYRVHIYINHSLPSTGFFPFLHQRFAAIAIQFISTAAPAAATTTEEQNEPLQDPFECTVHTNRRFHGIFASTASGAFRFTGGVELVPRIAAATLGAILLRRKRIR